MTKVIGSRLARLSLLVLLVGCLASFAAPPAAAQSLDELRAAGAVGERFDGYAMAREAGAKGVVDDVNRKRKKIYEERASAQGTTADQVGRVYAAQILQKAPPGTWFLEENGSWRQK